MNDRIENRNGGRDSEMIMIRWSSGEIPSFNLKIRDHPLHFYRITDFKGKRNRYFYLNHRFPALVLDLWWEDHVDNLRCVLVHGFQDGFQVLFFLSHGVIIAWKREGMNPPILSGLHSVQDTQDSDPLGSILNPHSTFLQIISIFNHLVHNKLMEIRLEIHTVPDELDLVLHWHLLIFFPDGLRRKRRLVLGEEFRDSVGGFSVVHRVFPLVYSYSMTHIGSKVNRYFYLTFNLHMLQPVGCLPHQQWLGTVALDRTYVPS